MVVVGCDEARGVPLHDLGSNCFDERDREHVRRRLTRRLEDLGYQVTVALQLEAIFEAL